MTTTPTSPAPDLAPVLAYGPPPRNRNRVAAVVIAGLVTTALTLFGVYLLNHNTDERIMGWYANYVIPVGALIVGLLAGLGYGIVSWITGVKIRKALLWTIVGLQVWAYFAAQYIEFKSMGPLVLKSTGEPLTFAKYYHIQAVSWAWKDKINNGKVGEPLGLPGYFFKLLEIVGFVGGGIIAPAVMMASPYCELCQAYMKTRQLALIPACNKGKFIKKKNEQEKQADVALFEAGKLKLTELDEAVNSNDGLAFARKIELLKPESKGAGKLPARFRVSLVRCKLCSAGIVRHELISGQGNRTNTQKLSEMHVTPEFVRAMLSAGATA
jgi:hypothetical protein